MAFSGTEIVGLVFICIAAVMQISAVATLKWRSYEEDSESISLGLFRICWSFLSREKCFPTSSDRRREAAYNTVKATAILSILDLLGLIAVIIIYKEYLKKSTFYSTIIFGKPAVLFGIATVIIYATAIDYGDEFKLGVSFFTSCGAVGLTLVGIIVHGIGAKNSE